MTAPTPHPPRWLLWALIAAAVLALAVTCTGHGGHGGGTRPATPVSDVVEQPLVTTVDREPDAADRCGQVC